LPIWLLLGLERGEEGEAGKEKKKKERKGRGCAVPLCCLSPSSRWEGGGRKKGEKKEREKDLLTLKPAEKRGEKGVTYPSTPPP